MVLLFLLELSSILFQSITLTNRISINILAGIILINLLVSFLLISCFNVALITFCSGCFIVVYLFELIGCLIQLFIFNLLSIEYCLLLFILYSLITNHNQQYISFFNFNYTNIIGFAILLVYTNQLITGILLSIYYNPFFIIAFDSIYSILININFGFIIRLNHVIGSSFFILLLLIHYIRSIYLKSKTINVNGLFYVISYSLFTFALIEAFIGYLLV